MKERQLISKEMRSQLRAPFPDEAYSSHPTKTFLTVLKAMYVTERLNDVFGIGRWTVETEIIERTEDYVLVQSEFHSLDYDIVVPKQFGGHKTTGKNTEIADGYKSAMTDSISKIASYLEVGIDMFKGKITLEDRPKKNDLRPDGKEKKWLNITPRGKDIPTAEWTNVLQGIADGTIKSLADVEGFYKVSKKVAQEIEKNLKNR